ncbi:hypothetical protein DL93DRAFT_1597957 [Clavulina sp. PMI_390]|nr:hypothetical protein DL93DRAFT_1597957 [Clavulina sp. PMI_390]
MPADVGSEIEVNANVRLSTNTTLPNELLGDIFILLYETVEGEDPLRSTADLTSLTLSHVCQQWRRVSIHISKLWSLFSVHSLDQKELFFLFLSRSGECRTHVRMLASCITGPKDTTLIIRPVHAFQIRSLTFDHAALIPFVLVSPEARSSLHLDSLSIQFSSHHQGPPIPNIFMQTKRLILSRMNTLARIEQPATPITDLCLETTDLSLVAKLVKLPYFEITTLELRGITGWRIEPPTLLSHLTSLSLHHCMPWMWQDLPGSFRCPSLRSLSVNICDRNFDPVPGEHRFVRDFVSQLVWLYQSCFWNTPSFLFPLAVT